MAQVFRAWDVVILPRPHGHGGLARVPFGLLGRDVAKCRVDALSIVITFDGGKQVASGLDPGRSSARDTEDHQGEGSGAGTGNRTRVFSLEGCCSTIELHPQR
jgi:hypothetical protein